MKLISRITSFITESGISRHQIKYRIRNDFKVYHFSQTEILKVIKHDLERNEIAKFKLIEERLTFENLALKNKDQAHIFLNHPLAGDLNTTDFGKIWTETKNKKRYVLFNYSIHSLTLRYFKNLLIWLIVIIGISIYSNSSFPLFAGLSVYFGIGLIGYIFYRFRNQSLIKRIIIREELKINNEL